jgi:V/A-type H+-transporting ATPase subunit E
MAIQDILEALDRQAEAECAAVLEEAHAQAEIVIAEAEREAQFIHEGYARQVERVAATEASKTVNAGRLQAKMMVSSTKGQAVDDVFSRARDELSLIPSDPSYPGLFDLLAAEAAEGLEGPLTVRVSPRDIPYAERFAAGRGDVTVDVDETIVGGLVIEASGGRVIRRNTLENRLERARLLVQADVAAVLFS